jgi:hypothetical protein
MELHKRAAPFPSAPTRELPEPPRCGLSELAPADASDPLIEAFKRDVDRTLLIENLKLTPAQRAEKFVDFMRFLDEMRRAGRRHRGEET